MSVFELEESNGVIWEKRICDLWNKYVLINRGISYQLWAHEQSSTHQNVRQRFTSLTLCLSLCVHVWLNPLSAPWVFCPTPQGHRTQRGSLAPLFQKFITMCFHKHTVYLPPYSVSTTSTCQWHLDPDYLLCNHQRNHSYFFFTKMHFRNSLKPCWIFFIWGKGPDR